MHFPCDLNLLYSVVFCLNFEENTQKFFHRTNTYIVVLIKTIW